MGKRKGKIIQKAEKPDLIASLSSLSIEEIDRLQKAAPMAFQSKLQAALNSNDAGEIMKANLYLGEINRQPTKFSLFSLTLTTYPVTEEDSRILKGFCPFPYCAGWGTFI